MQEVGLAEPDSAVDVERVVGTPGVLGDRERGRALRTELDAAADAVGVLVIADGANTLTAAAPGGFDPDSVARQAQWDDALAEGDVAALARLSGVLGRVAYQVLAGLAGSDPKATELYRGAPYGVGYFVGTWVPA